MRAVSNEDREKLIGQRGCVVWLTGLSGSGKTTIARELERQLVHARTLAYVLDGDVLRSGLSRDLGYSLADRAENLRRAAEVGAILADAAVVAIAAFISPGRQERLAARSQIGSDRFLEVFIDTPLEVCEARDAKGLYRRAREGQLSNFTGISSPYEAPEAADLVLATVDTTPRESARAIYRLMQERGLLQGARRGEE